MRFKSLNRTISLLALLTCAQAACGNDPGTGPGGTNNPDGGTGSDGGTGPEVYTGPVRTVTGTRIRTYITESGTTDVPVDMSKYNFSAFYRLPSGNFIARIGSGQSDGSFMIENVPEGDYWLRYQPAPVNGQVQAPYWLFTSANTIDLGADFAGRSNQQFPTKVNTNLVVNMQKMQTWSAEDDLQFFVPNFGDVATLNYETFFPSQGTPRLGDTTLKDYTVDFGLNGLPLVDATRGDQGYLTKVGQSQTTTGLYTVRQYFKPAQFTMTDGGSNAIGGDFVDVPQDQTLNINWQRQAFAALDLSISPQTDSTGKHNIGVSPVPYNTSRGVVGGLPDLMYLSTDVQTNFSGTYAYGNPFPATWSRVYGVSYTRTLHYLAPGSSMPAYLYGTILQSSGTPPSTITPALSPVTGIKVDGKAATGALTGISNTPTVSFTPPTTGTAAGYIIRVARFGVTSAGQTRAFFVTDMYVNKTEVIIPPGVLESSGLYVFLIKARSVSGLDLSTAPFRNRLPSATADALTETILIK